jgi:hypothetical protein
MIFLNSFVLTRIVAITGFATRVTSEKDARRLLIFTTCRRRFAETRCTVFFGTKYSQEAIRQILHHVAEGVGVRAAARLLGLSKDGVNRIILVAGEHCARVLQNLLTDLHLTEVQLDGLWVFIKKPEHVDAGG